MAKNDLIAKSYHTANATSSASGTPFKDKSIDGISNLISQKKKAFDKDNYKSNILQFEKPDQDENEEHLNE